MLRAHRPKLLAMAAELVDREVLQEEDIERLFGPRPPAALLAAAPYEVPTKHHASAGDLAAPAAAPAATSSGAEAAAATKKAATKVAKGAVVASTEALVGKPPKKPTEAPGKWHRRAAALAVAALCLIQWKEVHDPEWQK